MDPIKLLCSLAEEVGHHFTEAKSNILTGTESLADLLNVSIDELKAKIWAINFLIPENEFLELQTLEDVELANHFQVTLDFVRLRRQSFNILKHA